MKITTTVVPEPKLKIEIEMTHKVRNFTYNGFVGRLEKGFAPYTAEFITWTEDPGIMRMQCSDGKERFIPSFAIPHPETLPTPPVFPEGSKVFYWGQPSSSR